MGVPPRAATGQQRHGRGPLNERADRVRRRPGHVLRPRFADRQASVVCGYRWRNPCGARDLSGGRRTVRGNCGGTKSIDIRLAEVPTHGWHVTFGFRERVRAAASAVLPSPIKRSLKRLVRGYHRRFRAFTPVDLNRALVELGVVSGDVVMVHSAFDSFLGFQGGPVDVIRTLREVVGARGTLMMPTIPFRGTAVEYALGDPVFDVRRTVSRMGLLTEVFRRSPGVVRSIHPTHSVAVWGNRADAIIAGHERAETPCGRSTPYQKLLEYDGKILLAGVPANTMTFCYFVVEELEPQLAIPVFTREFELPRNPHSPVSPILKDLHVSFGCDYSSWHMSQPMPILGLCQWRTIPTRRPAATIARRLPVPDKADYGPNNASVDDGCPSNL